MATAPISENELVYDWNTQGDRTPPADAGCGLPR